MNATTKSEFISVPSTLNGPIFSSCIGLMFAGVVMCIFSFSLFRNNEFLFTVFSPANIIVAFIVIGLILIIVKNPGKWKNTVVFNFEEKTVTTLRGTCAFDEIFGYRALQSESLFSRTSYQIYLVNSGNKAIPLLSFYSAEEYAKAIACLNRAGVSVRI